jgi:flagellar hook assembly protein FlgD
LPRLAITAVVLALIGGTTAAFTLTEALKLERSPIRKVRVGPYFSPTCECRKNQARVSFRLREGDRLDAVVVDSDGEPVRALASGEERSPGKVVYRWDGKTDAGTPAADGAYRLRVHLDEQRRTIVLPNVFELDSEAPTVELVSLAPRILSPDGDGRRDVSTLEISLGETARPMVLVDGERAEIGPLAEAGESELEWAGTSEGTDLPQGTYVVGVQARDRAGNLSPPSSGITVRIHYVTLGRSSYRVRRGGALRFRVASDADRVAWRLVRRGRVVLAGAADPGAVTAQLPARVQRGRYVLQATANGHSDEAEVFVRPR